MRASDAGITIGTRPAGLNDAITDVSDIRVGHCTLISGAGPLVRGQGPVRTGVTVIDPGHDVWTAPVFAGFHRLNGKGDMTGVQWLIESGTLSSPIALSNTNALGTLRTGLIAHRAAGAEAEGNPTFSGQPVCGETNDSFLNDIAGFHVTEDHVAQALAAARPGAVEQGCVGGGTGMICHDFKAGIGTASRIADTPAGQYTVGVLVQANHGTRSRFTVNGVPVGALLSTPMPHAGPTDWRAAARAGVPAPGEGSIIVIVATDAPLLPHQLERIAQRAGMGIARTGGAGEYSSGDMIVAFSTAHRLTESTRCPDRAELFDSLRTLTDRSVNELYWSTIEATEEAIVNAVLSAETMSGRDNNTVYGLNVAELHDVLARFDLAQAPVP